MIDTLNAVFLFFDLSPKRQRFLERILDNMAPTTRKNKLVGLCKTRWVERHTCFDTFYDMYGYLCECLEAILDPYGYPDIYMDTWTGSWDQETRTKAQGLLASMCSSQTIIAFLVTKNALENVRPIASKLQKRDLDIYQAYGMIDQTKARIVTLRKDIEEEFSVWFEDATRLATLVGIPISAPRAPKSARQLHRLNAPSTTPKDLPNPPTLRAEIKEWQRFWNTKMPMESALSLNLVDCLDNADEDVFPNLNTLLRIGCILPVGSCEAERSFSCLRRLKTYLRNRMGENRLTGLALMNMNHDIDIDLDKVCQAFIQRHSRNMFAGCILYQ
ncbi:52 kDa repressor of the inhibitor of the protein kinase-like [Mizuhopecten yessoensis]|uniref:52 kDa repressor of the inhibitor of the protein kinase-like n=1 Tax=Mizuhopecten yessoensis TaxID=6573 RepID=UPI000B45DDFB|nr:52 kDa repressor of the inhibitor of the protein kinase-like [Mizuhopecten yessoensis]